MSSLFINVAGHLGLTRRPTTIRPLHCGIWAGGVYAFISVKSLVDSDFSFPLAFYTCKNP
jgi:hypothetical protein